MFFTYNNYAARRQNFARIPQEWETRFDVLHLWACIQSADAVHVTHMPNNPSRTTPTQPSPIIILACRAAFLLAVA